MNAECINFDRHMRHCDVLDLRGVGSILVSLLDSDTIKHVSDFREFIPNPNAIEKTLNELEAADLIKISERSPVRRSRTVSLTEKGKRVAEYLKLAKAELDSE